MTSTKVRDFKMPKSHRLPNSPNFILFINNNNNNDDNHHITSAVHDFTSQEVVAQTELHSPEGVSWIKPILCMDTRARGPGTVVQLRSWLWRCVRDHPKCRTALSGQRFGIYSQTSPLDQSQLPSRVLDVGSPNSPLVRLVETTPETPRPSAPYVALSHCWGPPDKRPLQTTLGTIEDYISSGIPFDRLPQTFADAVWVTRELGIRYLWIDALCIIQDSLSDWEAEAHNMCSVYEGATLTLGAAYARDSSEGLFKGHQRPDPEKVVRVYTHMEGYNPDLQASYPTDIGEFNAWNECPLSKRAWVMQEWSLSRRFVWAEVKSLHWKCREEAKTEAYLNYDVTFHIPSFDIVTSGWRRLIQIYSKMQLTYETDRLAALQGIVRALATSYRKDQEYHFGIWLDGHGTLLYLFWEMRDLFADSPKTGLPNIPSWSWASIAGAKFFPLTSLPSSNTERYYYDDRGITAENKATELRFCAPIGVVQLCVERKYDAAHRWRGKGSRYQAMSIYTTSADSYRPNGEVTIGCLTLDYTVDMPSCPPPSGFTRHVIPLVRNRNGDYMLVVEPANKPDGSKAYRRVGMGFVESPRSLARSRFALGDISLELEWSCWNKMLSEMKMEEIVLV
ncbi:heterokaryon incompatibility protein-domain-containing protein [Copromyces sp. CBS 386.78]|nr:heterokaryon incompatibility protein-domain-containing protein [Copromyces sp. CBS 386.78]